VQHVGCTLLGKLIFQTLVDIRQIRLGNTKKRKLGITFSESRR